MAISAIVGDVFKHVLASSRIPLGETSINVEILDELYNSLATPINITCPSRPNGYFFEHTFTDAGYFVLKLTHNSSIDYAGINIKSADSTAIPQSVVDQIDHIHTATNGKDIAQVSDLEITDRETYARLRLRLSTDFIAGGAVSRNVIRISGVDDAIYPDVNGDYHYLMMRNATSNFSSSPNDNTYPMWVNTENQRVIYAVTNNAISGATNYNVDDYDWRISEQGSIYNQLIDASDTSIPADGEYLSLDQVVFSGTGSNLVIDSAVIYDTVSSYGSDSASDTLIAGTVGVESVTVNANYEVILTNAFHNVSQTIKGDIPEGYDRGQTLALINNAVVDAVNADNTINGGLEWSVIDDYWVKTSQPFIDYFSGSVLVDNTDGTGEFGVLVDGVRDYIEAERIQVNIINPGLSTEQMQVLQDAKDNTDLIITKVDDISTDIESVLTKAQMETYLKANQLAVSADLITNPWTGTSTISGTVGVPNGQSSANLVTLSNETYITNLRGQIGAIHDVVGTGSVTIGALHDTNVRFRIWKDLGGSGGARFGEVVYESDLIAISSLTKVGQDLALDVAHGDPSTYNFIARYAYNVDISGFILPAGNYLVGYTNLGSNDIVTMHGGNATSINASVQYWGYEYANGGPDTNGYSNYYQMYAFYDGCSLEETILTQIKANAKTYRDQILRGLINS